MNKNFDPSKYGMMTCPLCNGKGFLYEDIGGKAVSARKVCTNCAGFAFIIKEEKTFFRQGNLNSIR